MSLKARIMLLVAAMTIIAVLTQFYSGYLSLQESEHRFSDAVLEGEKNLWKKISQHQFQMMSDRMSIVTRVRKFKKALTTGQADKELQYLLYTNGFSGLFTSDILHQIYLVRPDKSILLSAVDTPYQHFDHPLINNVLTQKTTFATVDKNLDGEVVYQFFFPVLKRAKVIGVAVFETNLQKSLNEFRNDTQSNALIFNDAGGLGYATEGAEELWQGIKSEKVTLGSNRVSPVKSDEYIYEMAMFPIKNHQGEPVAQMLTLEDQTESFQRQNERSMMLGAITLLVVIAAIILLGLFLKRMWRPLDRIVRIMQSISEGDLTVQIDVNRHDEIGLLQSATKQMVSHLKDMVEQIINSNNQLSSSALSLSSVAQQTSVGVEQQQNDTQSVVNLLQAVQDAVAQVIESRDHVKQAVIKSQHESYQGQEVVNHTIQSINRLADDIDKISLVINELNKNSSSIGDILSVIQGVAEQTNLLALNAAIEAARAGEQGRGFAVVADEVRTLATRTQKSTQEIRDVIERVQRGAQEAVTAMEEGSQQARVCSVQASKAGEALSSITDSVHLISTSTEQIENAVDTQIEVNSQISDCITQVSVIAGQTAIGANETKNASSNLSELISMMIRVTSRFKIDANNDNFSTKLSKDNRR